MQYYRYITTFNDPRWLRWTVLFVFFLDTVQTGEYLPCHVFERPSLFSTALNKIKSYFKNSAIMIYMVWEYTVTFFGTLRLIALGFSSPYRVNVANLS